MNINDTFHQIRPVVMEMESSIINSNGESKTTLCRVCLNCDSENRKHNLITLFEKYNGMCLYDKINYIVNIDIKEGDGYPDKICFSCELLLENAYKFKRTCEESNKILRSGVTFIKSITENEKLKEESAGSEYGDKGPISSPELQCNDVKFEYEFTELCDENHQSDFDEPNNYDINIPQISKSIDLHLECHDCGRFFRTKCKLRVHWKKEHMPSQLFCPKCKKGHKSYKALHAHIKRKTKQCTFASRLKIVGTGKSRVYHCTECDFNSKIIGSMMAHWVIHSGERAYSCEMCGKAFTQQGSLTIHQENVHKTRIVEATCHLCGKHVVGRGKLHKHMKIHTNDQFPCQVCDKVLKSKANLKQHMIRHSNIKAFSCDICLKTFYTASDITNHREKVHLKSKLFKCDRCDYETRNRNSISRHKKRHTDTNISCDICGMFVDNLQQMTFHKLRHNKNVECMYCHKWYYGKKNLQSHIRCKHNIRKNIKSRQKKKSGDSNI